jgi:cobalt/nickel transport system ATP-binding protein
MTEPLISLKNINFSYSPKPLFTNLNLEVSTGQRLAISGPNGCGKTTILHLIVGLLTPAGGSITLFGDECKNEPDFVKARRKIGLLFQDPDDQLFCPTVHEDIAFGPLNLGKSKDEAMETVKNMLELLDIKHLKNKIIYELSGGEKRLITLAGVLAMNPDILLLDEPTAGLDEKSEQKLVDILLSLNHTMIIVSHERSIINNIATSETIVQNGKANFPHSA